MAGETDRDQQLMRYVARKAAAREMLAPRTPGGNHDRGVGPRFIDVSGRYVPVGFARYVSPVIDPLDYEYYRIAGFRIAMPRDTPGPRVGELLDRIHKHGPQSAGFVRLGDTLVPAILGPGDRMTLAGVGPEPQL